MVLVLLAILKHCGRIISCKTLWSQNSLKPVKFDPHENASALLVLTVESWECLPVHLSSAKVLEKNSIGFLYYVPPLF